MFDINEEVLDEFKSDIDLYNMQRIAAAKQSGQHAKDKDKSDTDYNKASKETRDYGTSQYNGTRNTNAKKPSNAEDKKYIDMRNRNREEAAYNDIFDSTGRRIFNKDNPDKAKEYAYEKRLRKNESASIFDGPFHALDEFKGDAELQYSVRSIHDTMSGDHKYSKLYNSNKNGVRNMISGKGSDNSVSNMKQKREMDKYKDAARKEIKTTDINSRSEVSKKLKSLKDESASIFESLFSQI